jgi:uncharacterized protein (DUF1697 family)
VTRHVLLLRGINLGPRRRVSMPGLRSLLEDAGFADVVTHGQSGNVVVSSRKRAATVRRDAERAIADGVGFHVDVVVRTGEELAAVVDADPFGPAVVDEPKRYQVVFCADAPAPAAVRELEAADIAPERVAVIGREVFCWHANGIQQSPLARLVSDARIGTLGTARNWNTVLKLRALSRLSADASRRRAS